MELKVWVDGVVRVVCGLSEETSCQDVVIALAQAIGQTGRYILIQKLRDTERQLLANERPLESLAKLGQHSSEVQFFLRRTGPSSSEEQSLHNHTLPLHKPSTPEAKRGLPKKSFTFNLGPSVSSRTKTKTPSPEQRTSPIPHPGYVAGPSKEEIFRRILQQQEQLRALNSQLVTVETECESWEQSSSGEESSLQEEIDVLEKALWTNQKELEEEEFWETDLKVETDRERGMKRRLGELHAKLDDCGQKLHEFNTRAAQLEKDVHKERQEAELSASQERLSSKDSVEEIRAELQSRQKHGEELEAELTELQKALGRAETLLKAKQDDVEELNKELRQCNLQQFIQQAGALPMSSPSEHRTDIIEQLDLMSQQQDKDKNNDSPPRPTAKQFLGHPRNLQHPLVSSLNPEVLTSRESSWR